MKVAILFDSFEERGGAERIAIILAKHLKADIYTSYVNWDNADKELKKLNVNEIGLTIKKAKLLTYSEIAWRFSKLKLKNYDAYLLFRLYSFPSAKNHHPNIWISSGIFDLAYEFFNKKISIYKRPLFSFWFYRYRFFTKKWIKNFDKILSNSKFTKEEIKEYYNVTSDVAYHPIETKEFKCKSYEGFYLIPCRLTLDKRIDIAIEAFKQMPDKKLIVIGDGPEKEKLRNLAKGFRNIKILDGMDYEKIVDYYAKCTATLSLGAIESLGLIPLESMASGKPCIATNFGGHKETIINSKTGFLIKPDINEVKKYVNVLTPDKAKSMKRNCLERVKMFDAKIFVEKVKKEIRDL